MSDATTIQTLRFLQMENLRLQEENEALREEVRILQEYVQALRALSQATRTITSEIDLVALLDKIMYAALNVMDSSDGSLILLDEDTDELVFVVVRGSARETLQGYRIPKDMGIAGWVVTHAEPQVVNKPTLDHRFSGHVDETFDFRTNSLMCAPLIAHDRVIGVIEVLNKFSGQDFNEADFNLLTILAHIAAEAIDKVDKRLEAEEQDE
jgi:GAF domain-containing protein